MRDWHGQPITDVLMLLNASPDPVDFTLPNHAAHRWALVLDTGDERGFVDPQSEHGAGEKLPLPERSLMLLRRLA